MITQIKIAAVSPVIRVARFLVGRPGGASVGPRPQKTWPRGTVTVSPSSAIVSPEWRRSSESVRGVPSSLLNAPAVTANPADLVATAN